MARRKDRVSPEVLVPDQVLVGEVGLTQLRERLRRKGRWLTEMIARQSSRAALTDIADPAAAPSIKQLGNPVTDEMRACRSSDVDAAPRGMTRPTRK